MSFKYDQKAVTIINRWKQSFQDHFGIEPTMQEVQQFYSRFADVYVNEFNNDYIRKAIRKNNLKWNDTAPIRDVIRGQIELPYYMAHLDEIMEADLTNHMKLVTQYKDFLTADETTRIEEVAAKIHERKESEKLAAETANTDEQVTPDSV